VAIIAIALQIAVPSFVAFQRNSALSSAASNLTATLNNARSEAMTRGVRTRVVPADTTWSSGTISFVDVDGSGDPGATNNVRLNTQPGFPSYITITGPAQFQFEPSGFATNNVGTISLERNDVSSAELPRETRRVKVANTGRVRVCTPTSATDSTCLATTTSN
jgi:type IV fimbrial biogenesis protein FimT